MAILFALISFCSTGLGGLAALRLRDRLHLAQAFGAGAVLGVVFFDIQPEVFSLEPRPPGLMLATAGGFLAFFLLERATAFHGGRHHASAPAEHAPEVGIVAAAGLSAHSFLDGVAIGTGFQVQELLGIVIAAAVIAHDFNDGLNTVTVMLAHGNPPRRSVALLLLDMVAPVAGATAASVIHLPEATLAWLLAFFAGVFLYIGAADLLPEAREHASPLVFPLTAAGFATLFAVTSLLPR